jgi:hypothetical protein
MGASGGEEKLTQKSIKRFVTPCPTPVEIQRKKWETKRIGDKKS